MLFTLFGNYHMKTMLAALVDQIVDAGKNRGMDQKTLVQKAGLSASTLSKLKQADDVRLSTLERLASVVGLRINLVSNDPVLEKLLNRKLFTDADADQD